MIEVIWLKPACLLLIRRTADVKIEHYFLFKQTAVGQITHLIFGKVIIALIFEQINNSCALFFQKVKIERCAGTDNSLGSISEKQFAKSRVAYVVVNFSDFILIARFYVIPHICFLLFFIQVNFRTDTGPEKTFVAEVLS